MKTKLFGTDQQWALTALRILLGLVVFSHGAQAMLGWFGGPGLTNTLQFLTQQMALPFLVAFAVIAIQFFGSLMLVLGLGTRVAALGIFGIFSGMATYHFDHGFFMNWSGTNQGEGFEYHVLVMAMCTALFIAGGGAFSFDRKIAETK